MTEKTNLIANNFDSYLDNHENKELLRFITCGSVDDGKSTLIGRLLHDSKMIYEDQLVSLKKNNISSDTLPDSESFDLAAIVDGLQAEREQGITIDVAYRFFSTEKRKFIIADTPGHVQYTRNMVTGSSNADLAIILVDAEKGISTQTKRHTFIVSLLGVQNLFVLVNKMDSVSFKEDVFNSIRDDFLDFTKKLELTKQVTEFLPVSALKGDNIVEPSESMDWFSGHTLLQMLETVPIKNNYNYSHFRFPVQYVLRPDSSFRGYSGTVSSGTISVGDPVLILPSRQESKIKSIVSFDGNSEKAVVPAAVTLTLENDIDISRGDMIVAKGDEPIVTDTFDAMLVWMTEDKLSVDKQYYIQFSTLSIVGYVEEFYYKLDMDSMQKSKTEELALNEIGYVRIRLAKPIPIDKFTDLPGTGNLILVDRVSNETSGAAMVHSLQERRHLVWHDHVISKKDRSEMKGHSSAVLWLTGLSASGKSTIANALELKLCKFGFHTFLLDGDNVRQRLNHDLDFSEKGRHENIRRIGEVASLFIDAGILTITSFISPLRADRDMVRKMVDDNLFVEIYISTPIEVCEARDPKGFYRLARKGEIKKFTGIDSPYEEPLKPEITIDTSETSIEEAVDQIYDYLIKKGYLTK